MGQLVCDHRLEHPGRHLPEGSVESDDPGLRTVATPLGRLVGDETNLGNLGRIRKPGGHLARERLGATVRVEGIRTGPPNQRSSQFDNRLVELPYRNPMRCAHRQSLTVQARVDVFDPLSNHLEFEGHSVHFQGPQSICHGQHCT